MSAITVRFACGHQSTVSATTDTPPMCPACGEARVQSVKARAPRFVGACTGPYAVTQALEALPVNLAPQGALTLKPPEE